MPVLGVDGWRGRWAGALLEGRSVRLLVHEVFPELSFRALDDRVLAPRASARGLAQRLRALQPVPDVLDALAEAPPGLPAMRVGW